jgi:hypothetical protein
MTYETRSEKREFRRSNDLPYGMWTCEDGREVLFNRFYKPIWQRLPGKPPQPADPNEWVPWKRQRWFYDDGTRNKSTCAKGILVEWGISRP